MKIEWTKIAKGESRGKEKAKISSLPKPSRLLSSEKIAKGESRDGGESEVFRFDMARPKPYLIQRWRKVSAEKTNLFEIFTEPPPVF